MRVRKTRLAIRGTKDADKEEDDRSSNMSGTFRNLQITTLLAVSLAVVMVQRAEGYPHKWENVSSYGNAKEPTTRASWSSGHRVSSSLSKDYRKETEVGGEVIPYELLWSDDDGKNENPHVNERLVSRRAQDVEDDDNFSDESSDESSNEDSGYNLVSIAQGFMQAATNGIFLSPEDWADTLPNKSSEMPHNQAGTGISGLGDIIVFPDALPNLEPVKLRFPVAKCTGKTFCLDPPQYPSNAEIEDALKRRYLPPVTEPPSIAERFGPTEDNLCVSQEQVILPKSAATDTKEWDWVVNTENYAQTVKVEFCQTNDAPCQIINNIVDGYKTFCKQKYVYRNLVAIGPQGTVMKPFRMPSSCCCHIQFVGNPMLRMGLGSKQSPLVNGIGN